MASEKQLMGCRILAFGLLAAVAIAPYAVWSAYDWMNTSSATNYARQLADIFAGELNTQLRQDPLGPPRPKRRIWEVAVAKVSRTPTELNLVVVSEVSKGSMFGSSPFARCFTIKFDHLGTGQQAYVIDDYPDCSSAHG